VPLIEAFKEKYNRPGQCMDPQRIAIFGKQILFVCHSFMAYFLYLRNFIAFDVTVGMISSHSLLIEVKIMTNALIS
jgi:hypothetical protein